MKTKINLLSAALSVAVTTALPARERGDLAATASTAAPVAGGPSKTAATCAHQTGRHHAYAN